MRRAGLVVTGGTAAFWVLLAALALFRLVAGPAFDEPEDRRGAISMLAFGLALGGFSAFCCYKVWED